MAKAAHTWKSAPFCAFVFVSTLRRFLIPHDGADPAAATVDSVNILLYDVCGDVKAGRLVWY